MKQWREETEENTKLTEKEQGDGDSHRFCDDNECGLRCKKL